MLHFSRLIFWNFLKDDSQPVSTYNPQVEAISPTLPSEVLQEDANFRATKDDLLNGIAKVDREITKTESQITKLKRKQVNNHSIFHP